MIQIAWKATGVFAVRVGKAEPLIAQAGASAVRTSLFEWASGTGQTQTRLADRLAPSGFNVYGFTKRAQEYQWRQRKALGVVRPYFSPRDIDLSDFAIALARGKAFQVLRAAQRISRTEHMARLVVRPGGFTLATSRGARRVAVTIRYPGARILNRGGPQTEIYRQEFRDFSRGGRRDARAIINRTQVIFGTEFGRLLDRMPARRIA